jgi:hypothetical protein
MPAQLRPDGRHDMKRFLRLLTTLIASLALALTGLTVMSAPAQAAADCSFPPCGRVVNNTDWNVQISWYVDSDKAWHYEWLAPGQARGGYWNDGIDVDRFNVHPGCVAEGTFGGGVQWFWPSGQDKLSSDKTVELRSIRCGDGYVYAWENAWNDNSEGGRWCRWFNGDNNWQDDCGNFRNIASSVQNNSSAGNNVRFYIHPSNTGAYACLGRGDAWRDLSKGIVFSFSPGLDGYWASANNNIASHRWVTNC